MDGPQQTSSVSVLMDIIPVLTYQLNRHIFLESRLNLFGFSMTGFNTVLPSDGLF